MSPGDEKNVERTTADAEPILGHASSIGRKVMDKPKLTATDEINGTGITIAVFGSSQPQEGSDAYEQARSVGRAIAVEGWTLVCGGYRGVMTAASRGAKEGGGTTIGVTTAFFEHKGLVVNRWIDHEIKTPTYASRLVKLTEMADGYVVLRGGAGTLTELFLSWELVRNQSVPRRPIVLYGSSWRRVIDSLARELADEAAFSRHMDMLRFAQTPGEVVAELREGFQE